MHPVFKRTLSFLLALILCFGAIPVPAFASEAETVQEAPSQTDPTIQTLPSPETSAPPAETTLPQESSIPEESSISEETVPPEETAVFEETIPLTETFPAALSSAAPDTLSIDTLPHKLSYKASDPIDLTGLVLLLIYDDGTTLELTPDDGITIVSGDTSAAGKRTIEVAYGDLTVSFLIVVHTQTVMETVLQDSAGYPESDHNYANNANETYFYSCHGAQSLTLNFSSSCYLESSYDYVKLYDSTDSLIGSYTGGSLAGTSVTVEGDSVTIILTSDYSNTKYGFSLDSIYAYVEQPVHETTGEGVYTPHGCFTDGYTTYSCWICDAEVVVANEGSAAHTYADGYCTLCSLPENALATGQLGESIQWALTDENLLYICGIGDMPDQPAWDSSVSSAQSLRICEGITGIGANAFYGFTALTSVSLPDSLTAIGDSAFYNCYSMTGLVLPENLESIGKCAFYNCDGLTSLYIPASVSTITASSYSQSPFYGCISSLELYCEAEPTSQWDAYWNYCGSSRVLPTTLHCTAQDYAFWNTLDRTAASIELPEGITVIPANVFNGRSTLTSVTLPATLVSIGDYAFYNCDNLTGITLPAALTEIGSYAFYDCDKLTSLNLPDGLKTVGSYALCYCEKLTELTLPSALETIGAYAFAHTAALSVFPALPALKALGDYAFYSCSSLTEVTLPGTLESMGSRVFSYCTNLTTVTAESGLETLGDSAFYSCKKLTSVTLPDTLTALSAYLFQDCTALAEISLPASLAVIGDYAFYNCDALASVTLPDSVTSIGSYAFANCAVLSDLALPAGLTSLGSYFLNNTPGITQLTMPASLTAYTYSALSGSSVSSVIFAEGTTEIPAKALYNASNVTEVIIPSTVTSIGESAFYSCSSLTAIQLPSGLTSIGNYAFQNCCGLTAASLPDSLTTIGSYAFRNCTALTSIQLPASVTSFGSYIFYNCTALTQVVLEEGATLIPSYLFGYCTALTDVTIPSTVTMIDSYAFSNCSALTQITLPEGLEGMGYCVFYGCFALTELRLPGTIRSISVSSYRGPLDGSGVTRVILGDGFTDLPSYLLASNSSGSYASRITEVVFENPGIVTSFGTRAFYNCVALTDFVMPENVVNVESYCFYNCTSLTQVTVSPGQTLGNYAYASCASLQTLVIGDGAHIGNYAFQNCSNLSTLICGDDVTLDTYAFYGLNISGSCGDSMTYALDLGAGVLTLAGSGDMYDYSADDPAPWHGVATMITDIAIGDAVTSIGDYAFAGCTRLQDVILTSSIDSVGENAFSGCSQLTYVEIPDGVGLLEEGAFANCDSLTQAAFLGDAPVMERSVFGSGNVKVLYPETYVNSFYRIFIEFAQYLWTKWDDTIPTIDVVLLLDVSGSMYGKTAQLSQAATQLIGAIGGATKKTSISVIEYDDGTKQLCDFTTNVRRLKQSVANLYDQGGTEYRNALVKAHTALQSRSGDLQFVVMFSDGEPNDSTSAINAYAQTMRDEGIIIYTVGLLSSASQRNTLINVAGSVSRYFEASNIAGLVAAFEELSRNFGKSEYTTAEMKINGIRWDLFSEVHSYCLSSQAKVSLYLTKGFHDMYEAVTEYALEQNGKIVLRSTTGAFEDIVLKDHFQANAPIYAVLLDADGNVIERREICLTFVDSYEITYVYGPDMDNKIYKTVTFIPGNELDKPKDPTRIGYDFKGWYASSNGEGLEFFDDLNIYNRENIQQDMTLYAKWQEHTSDFVMQQDNWGFYNSATQFDANYDSATNTVHTDYEMTTGDYKKLQDIANSIDWLTSHRIWYRRYDTWGGSCFGMSSSSILAKSGDLKVSSFPNNGKSYYTPFSLQNLALNKDKNSPGATESMINFYQLSQFLPGMRDVWTSYSKSDESANTAKIIAKMIEADGPVNLCIRLSGGYSGGHSIVAFDLRETAAGYTFQVYDCSVNKYDSYTVEVTVSGSTYTVSCASWENAWYNSKDNKSTSILLGCAFSQEDLKEYPILTSPGTVQGRTLHSTENESHYELSTSYGSFTIFDGTNSAVISNGQKTSGNLSVSCIGQTNMVDADTEYTFYLPALPAGSTYTITQSGSGKMETIAMYDHSADGFFLTHVSDIPGTIIVGASGSLDTKYSAAVSQDVNFAHISMDVPWNIVNISGSSTGFTLAPNASSVVLHSEKETTVDIQAISDFNSLTLTNVPVNSEPSLIQESENSCVVLQNNRVVAGDVYGYSVAFDSQMGTNVATLTNVPYGSLVEKPTDPTKVGYIFQGWFLDEDHTTAWNFDTDTVTGDLILYAGWSVNPNYLQTITFRLPNQPDEIVYLPKGELIPQEYAPADPDGEAYVWYTRADFTNAPWDFSKDTVTGDLVLYGKTTLSTVSFVTNCAITADSLNIYTGNHISEPTGLTKPGYTLCGWYLEEDFITAWDFETDVVTQDMCLYAKWIENIIDKNGDDTGISIELLNEQGIIYTGKAIKPTVVVRDAGRILTEGTDYTLGYKNNTNACDHTDPSIKATKLPQITVQGKGNYKSSKKITVPFTIHQADMADLQVTVPEIVAVKSGNKLQTLKPTVSTGLTKLSASAYTLRFYMDAALTKAVSGITSAGTYYVVLEAAIKNGIYTGNVKGITAPIAVVAAAGTQMLSSARLTTVKSIPATSKTLTAEKAIQSILSKVVLNKVTYLTDNANIGRFLELFTVTAVDSDGTLLEQEKLGQILNTVGKKTLIVSARDENDAGLVGSKTAAITVKGISLSKNQFLVSFADRGSKALLKADYTGISQTPDIYTDLTEGVDYTVSFLKGKTPLQDYQIRDAGSYSLVISGMGKYAGTLTYQFTISPLDLVKAYSSGKLTITVPGQAVFNTASAQPGLTASYDSRMTLAEGRDYTLKYSGNTKVTASAAISMTGKGNFKGTLTKKQASELIYAISPKSLTSSDIRIAITGITFKQDAVSAVKFSLTDGTRKIAASQYSSSFTDNGDSITLIVTAAGKDYTGTRRMNLRKDLINVNSKKLVKVSLVSTGSFYYTGSAIHPEILVTDAQNVPISQDCFDVTYGANDRVGSGTVTVTGRPDMGYYGSVTVKFTILPKWLMWLFG